MPLDTDEPDVWANGVAYDGYVGRWSRLVADELVATLAVPAGARWLDVGCGAGALTAAILAGGAPASVLAIDSSCPFLEYARQCVTDSRAEFRTGDAQALDLDDEFDAIVSGLVLNFLSDPGRAVAGMAGVARAGGTLAAYVWDYGGEMQLIRRFWDAAVQLDPAAVELDEGRRFPLARPAPLERLFRESGLRDVAVRAIDVPTVFRDFDDYWTPFLGGQGPAGAYAVSLSPDLQVALAECLSTMLPRGSDGSIELTARAWVVQGQK
jgi:SAM-dependent methyltransferase